VVLSGSESFRPVSPVVFVPLVEGEEATRVIEARVRRGPLDRRLLFPYHPHVTVAHEIDEKWLDEAAATMLGYRAVFEVASLGLFVQGEDKVWRQRVEYAFGG
jgi:2'-5' RNA ligase